MATPNKLLDAANAAISRDLGDPAEHGFGPLEDYSDEYEVEYYVPWDETFQPVKPRQSKQFTEYAVETTQPANSVSSVNFDALRKAFAEDPTMDVDAALKAMLTFG